MNKPEEMIEDISQAHGEGELTLSEWEERFCIDMQSKNHKNGNLNDISLNQYNCIKKIWERIQ